MKTGFLCALLTVLSFCVSAQNHVTPRKADSIKRIAMHAEGVTKADQLFELAKLYVATDLDSAKFFFEEAITVCRQAKDDTVLIKLLCKFPPILSDAGEKELARHYLVIVRDTEFRVDLPHKFTMMIVKALYNIQYWYFTDYDSCIYYAQKYIQAAGDSVERATGYIELASAYNEMGDNIKALETYNTAQAYLQSPHTDAWTLSYLYNNLGMLYSDERELKKSEEYYLKAVEYAQASNVPAADLSALNNLGLLYNWLGDYDKSLEYLNMAAERLPAYKDLWAYANNHLNIGHTLTLAGRSAEGLERYGKALEMFSKLKDDYTVATVRIGMAEAYRLLHRYREAEREAMLARDWDMKHGYGEVVKDSYEELYQIYEGMGRFDKAFEYQNKYLKIIDSLNRFERKTKFGLLEKNFEIAQQERVRERLENENALHLAQAKGDRTRLIALIAGTGVLGLAVIVAVVAYRRSRIQNAKIEEQAEQLREAAKTKARFFANVSHELRTPVTLLNGMLELMQEDPSHGTREKMDIALGSSRRLQGMLNEVLDLSRVEVGKWELTTKRKEILPLLNRIVLAFESLMVRKKLELQYNAHILEGLAIDIDEDKFEKIMNNLIYNAIKFNHEGGWIHVWGNRTDAMVVLQVEDSGIGIPDKELPYIFDRFYQSTSTDKLNAQGIGIGLSLVREFTELHGGVVSVTSEVGKGSRFTIQLPIRETGATQAEPVEESAEITDVTFDNFGRKPQLLIVEDNDDMRFYLKEILGDHVTVAEAHHGREGLAWLKSHKPDLIISDVMMPEMDGYEFLTQLKASPTHRGIPVVMLTARATEEDLLHGLGLGVDDYIIKPFNARELKIRVHNLLTNQEIRKEWSQKPIEAEEIVAAGTAEDNVLLEKIKTYVEANAANPTLGIADLGDHLAMSERQVYRKAATLTGMTPAQLIKEIRLRIAYRLLLERKISKVAELAKRVGFENSSYFSRQFLERYGKRPADWL